MSIQEAMLSSQHKVQVRAMAEKYFGGWRQEAIPALPPSPSELLAQPPAGAERRLDSSARGGPALMQAFYRPGIASADAPILDVIGCGPTVHPSHPRAFTCMH